MATRSFNTSLQLLSSMRPMLPWRKMLSPPPPLLSPLSHLFHTSPHVSMTVSGGRAVVGGARGGGRREMGGEDRGGLSGVLGIRREESSVWERRAPLSPNHVQSLISRGIKVYVTTVHISSFVLYITAIYLVVSTSCCTLYVLTYKVHAHTMATGAYCLLLIS